MSTRTILVVFLALFSGAGVAVGVLQSNRKAGATPASTEMVKVLVAIGNIERGQAITEADVQVENYRKGDAPPDTLKSVDEAVGRPAVMRILEGDLVREQKLAEEGAGFGLAPIIPVGMRAVTIVASRVNTNVAGFVLPGSKVDVLLNLRNSGRGDDTGGGSTTTLLQAVDVLAVDQIQVAPDTNQFDPKTLASVTLLVTPKQANVLDLAQNTGTLSFALRNSFDVVDSEVEPATLDEIRRLGMSPNQPVTPFDGDYPPPPEMLALLTGDAPRTEQPESKWIDTMRGTQRGRVVLSDR